MEQQLPGTLEEILQKSIQLEEEGYKYYNDSAVRVTNSVGKRMLERLAGDEKNHIRRFKDLYDAVTSDQLEKVALKKMATVTFDELFNRMRDQLDGAIEELGEKGVDDAEIIEMALDLESHTKIFYQKAAAAASDKKVKEFYEMLATEEQAHYDVLQKALEFLEDPSLFFGMGSRKA